MRAVRMLAGGLVAVLATMCMAGAVQAAMPGDAPRHCASPDDQRVCQAATASYALPAATLPDVHALIVPAVVVVNGQTTPVHPAADRHVRPFPPRSPPAA